MDSSELSPTQYRSLALRTRSEKFNAQYIKKDRVRAALEVFIAAAERLGEIKSDLFYKDVPENPNKVSDSVPTDLDGDLVHGILGVADEAGELAEVLWRMLEKGDVDVVNLFEERGDIDWFENLIDYSAGFDQPVIWAGNIQKLAERFSGEFEDVEFTSDNALTRDREEERKVLKESITE